MKRIAGGENESFVIGIISVVLLMETQEVKVIITNITKNCLRRWDCRIYTFIS